jgi:hypothetical protein
MVTTARDIILGILKIGDEESKLETTFGDSTNQWTIGVAFICLLAPLTLVRNLAYFSLTFTFGNLMILLTTSSIVVFSIYHMADSGLS